MAENYREYEREVINGTLEINGTLDIKEGATLKGLPQASKVTAVATGDEATASGNATAINAIISALQTAGLMATS